MRSYVYTTSIIACALFALTDGAFAGVVTVPGPIVGAGAPGLLAVAGAIWLVRRMRKKDKQ
jgi:lipopolysaccharide export LptBFGC system permease protein LptF